MALDNARGFLRVPVRLQAMCLASELPVVRATADYRRLPFVAGDYLYPEGYGDDIPSEGVAQVNVMTVTEGNLKSSNGTTP